MTLAHVASRVSILALLVLASCTTVQDQPPPRSARVAAITADPFGSKGIALGALHAIGGRELRLDRADLEGAVDLVPLVRAVLKLFHNMRAALHVPDQVPDTAPPASGPGRNDAFGLLSAVLFGAP